MKGGKKMPTEERCNTGAEVSRLGENPLKSSLTKQRYVELVQLAKIASEKLIEHGLQRHEYCEFGNIIQRIMQLE